LILSDFKVFRPPAPASDGWNVKGLDRPSVLTGRALDNDVPELRLTGFKEWRRIRPSKS
jgi:hypothetical protein